MSGEARIKARDCRLGVVILCSVDSISDGTLGHNDGEVEDTSRSDLQHDAIRDKVSIKY